MGKRIDVLLVELGMFETRSKAQTAIEEGDVFYDNELVTRNNLDIKDNLLIKVIDNKVRYVSRAGQKLEHAIVSFNIDLANKEMLDIGSSTGGFVDCAIKHGVRKVIAVDVGSDQMVESLKKDKKVEVYEKLDFRDIDYNIIKNAEVITIDVSFISVKHFINKIKQIGSCKEIICLIKPQFECGKQLADKYKGVIRDKSAHKKIIFEIIALFHDIGFFTGGIKVSPVKGKRGNTEYLVYFVKNQENSISEHQMHRLINQIIQ